MRSSMSTWVHSMHGVPWTPKKMRQAVSILRDAASVGFAFAADRAEQLADLDARVFAERPDLWLHAWSTAPGSKVTDGELAALVALRHVRRLQLSGLTTRSLDRIGELTKLTELSLAVGGTIDLGFIARLPALRHLTVHGRIVDLAPLARCARLERVRLSGTLPDLAPLAGVKRLSELAIGGATVRSLAVLGKLPRLRTLSLDTTTIACSPAPIGTARGLVELSITNTRELRDAAFLGELTRLTSLRIDQPHVRRLPDLSALRRLHAVQLGGMKAWENPEVLATLKQLRELALSEINPKLPAERFFFLAELASLRSLDVRFIDFGTRRPKALTAHLVKAGKRHLLAT